MASFKNIFVLAFVALMLISQASSLSVDKLAKRRTTTEEPTCMNGNVYPYCCANGSTSPYCCENGSTSKYCCENNSPSRYCCPNGSPYSDCREVRRGNRRH